MDMIDRGNRGGGNIYKPVDVARSAQGVMQRWNPEEALSRISDKEFREMAGGLATLYTILFVQENPVDALVMPTRGAGPLRWGLEEMCKRTGRRMPLMVDIPLGTSTDIYNERLMRGMKGQAKHEVLESYFNTLYDLHKSKVGRGGRGIERVLLVDESKTGGTITQAAHHIHELQKEWRDKGWKFEFVIVVFQDVGRSHGISDKAVCYMLSEKTSDRCYRIATSLPVMDVRHLLPVILRQDPKIRSQEARYETWELLENVGNPRARKVFTERLRCVLDEMGWPELYCDDDHKEE